MEYIDINAFFNANDLLQVNVDDTETGDFRLMETETDRVKGYIKEGYKVATIYEETEGDFMTDTDAVETVVMAFEEGSPFIVGYFILDK